MKRSVLLLCGALLLSVHAIAQNDSSRSTSSQVKEDFKEAGLEIKETAVKVGNKSAEIGVKAFSAIKDNKVPDKVGPDGQTIYIDSRSRYYYVNEKGGKVYIDKARLKNK